MPTTKKTTAKGQGTLDSLPEIVVDDVSSDAWKNSTTFKVGMEIVEAKVVDRKKEIAEAKNKGGRPTIFNKDLAFEICERIINGESLRSILKDEGMPALATVFRWRDDNEWFRDQYTWAKDNQADTNSEDIHDLAKKVVSGEVEPQAARVAIDAYKWTASKLKPKKYGDKLDLTSDGKQLPTPIISIAAAPETKEINS